MIEFRSFSDSMHHCLPDQKKQDFNSNLSPLGWAGEEGGRKKRIISSTNFIQIKIYFDFDMNIVLEFTYKMYY